MKIKNTQKFLNGIAYKKTGTIFCGKTGIKYLKSPFQVTKKYTHNHKHKELLQVHEIELWCSMPVLQP
jgi:hypothetical protein